MSMERRSFLRTMSVSFFAAAGLLLIGRTARAVGFLKHEVRGPELDALSEGIVGSGEFKTTVGKMPNPFAVYKRLCRAYPSYQVLKGFANNPLFIEEHDVWINDGKRPYWCVRSWNDEAVMIIVSESPDIIVVRDSTGSISYWDAIGGFVLPPSLSPRI